MDTQLNNYIVLKNGKRISPAMTLEQCVQSVQWREKKLDELHQYIAYKRLEEAKKNKPRDYTRIFFIIAINYCSALIWTQNITTATHGLKISRGFRI